MPQQVASFNAGFPSTVYEFVKSGRYPRSGWFRRLNKHDEEHVQASLEAVGMWENRHKRIGSLSGGQKQRVVIARMFASDPDIFVLDEPTTGMDSGTTDTFYELMHHSAHQHGKSVLMITHDPEEVKAYADRNIHLVRNQNFLGVVSTFMKLKQMTKKEVMVMLDILSYDFMQRAVMAVVAISILLRF